MQRGAFSISPAVKDIAASRAFYEKLGFSVFGGDQEQRWLIKKSGSSLIGLFEGMFERNLLTFNPGWDSEAKVVPGYEDVRSIQTKLEEHGLTLDQEADSGTTGPACPDGRRPSNRSGWIRRLPCHRRRPSRPPNCGEPPPGARPASAPSAWVFGSCGGRTTTACRSDATAPHGWSADRRSSCCGSPASPPPWMSSSSRHTCPYRRGSGRSRRSLRRCSRIRTARGASAGSRCTVRRDMSRSQHAPCPSPDSVCTRRATRCSCSSSTTDAATSCTTVDRRCPALSPPAHRTVAPCSA